MSGVLFNHRDTTAWILRAGTSEPSYHRFGGPPRHATIGPVQPAAPLHLLFDLDTADPRLATDLLRPAGLPLYYGFVFGGSSLSYLVRDEATIEVLNSLEHPPTPGFPHPDYPAEFPVLPVTLSPLPHDPRQLANAMRFSGVFGLASLSAEDQARARAEIDARSEGFGNPTLAEQMDDPTIEDYANFHGSPMTQGTPRTPCPNPACDNHGQADSMRVFGVIPAEPAPGVRLWGDADVILIYEICTSCRSTHVSNQSD